MPKKYKWKEPMLLALARKAGITKALRKKKKKKKETKRTRDVSKNILQSNALTKEELDRLKGKKK